MSVPPGKGLVDTIKTAEPDRGMSETTSHAQRKNPAEAGLLNLGRTDSQFRRDLTSPSAFLKSDS